MPRLFQTVALAALVLSGLVGCATDDTEKHPSRSSSPAGRTTPSAPTLTAYPTQRRAACGILTLDDGRRLLGTRRPVSSSSQAERAHRTTTLCIRARGRHTLALQAVLVVRAPRDAVGARAIRRAFARAAVAPRAVRIDGYGERAFWSEYTGQLHVLDRDNWYTMGLGRITPASYTRENAREVADMIRADFG